MRNLPQGCSAQHRLNGVLITETQFERSVFLRRALARRWNGPWQAESAGTGYNAPDCSGRHSKQPVRRRLSPPHVGSLEREPLATGMDSGCVISHTGRSNLGTHLELARLESN